MKGLRRSWIGWAALLLVASAMPAAYLFKSAHRLDEPPALSPADADAALKHARQMIERALAPDARSDGDPGRSDVDLGVLGHRVDQPVFVTVYGTGSDGRRMPPTGAWIPAPGQSATLGEALGVAARHAAESLDATPGTVDRLASPAARIKIDLAGPSRALWGRHETYLGFVLDPGRDGVMGEAGARAAWFLPSWTVERNWPAARGLEWVGQQLVREGETFAARRFRTRAYVEGTADEPGARPIFRGNVLLPRLDADAVHRSLELSGAYLARMVDAAGKYCYTYNPVRDRCDDDYNLLRHAGTTYSLFQIQRVAPSPEILEAAERATKWLRKRIRLIDGDPSRAYVFDGQKTSLGGAGLALIALAEREKAVGDGWDRTLMRQLGNLIIGQQREDGYLHSWVRWRPDVVVKQTNVMYYTGEALLALLRLHDVDPRPEYLEAAVKAARYLALDRWRWGGIELFVPQDAWLAQALAELYPKVQDPRLKEYCYKLIDVTAVRQLRADDGVPPDMAGGPSDGLQLPWVTPAGSRNEAITAAYRMARFAGDDEKAREIKALSVESGRFQINQQFRPANSYYLPDPARAAGGFRPRPDRLDVRIDYVQHNVTALLGVLDMLKEGEG